MRKCILLVALAVVTGGCSWSRPNADPELGRLIVFVQPGGSSLDLDFHRNHLPAIRQTANGLGVSVVTRNAARGAPAELTVTPALVYQNHRGRSIYYGRYTTLGRVRTFLRTARFAPQAGETLRRVRTPVWRIGRARHCSRVPEQSHTRHLQPARPHLLRQSVIPTALTIMLRGCYERCHSTIAWLTKTRYAFARFVVEIDVLQRRYRELQ